MLYGFSFVQRNSIGSRTWALFDRFSVSYFLCAPFLSTNLSIVQSYFTSNGKRADFDYINTLILDYLRLFSSHAFRFSFVLSFFRFTERKSYLYQFGIWIQNFYLTFNRFKQRNWIEMRISPEPNQPFHEFQIQICSSVQRIHSMMNPMNFSIKIVPRMKHKPKNRFHLAWWHCQFIHYHLVVYIVSTKQSL